MELAFRSRLRQMRGNKTRKQFAEEIGMKESNYLKIEFVNSAIRSNVFNVGYDFPDSINE